MNKKQQSGFGIIELFAVVVVIVIVGFVGFLFWQYSHKTVANNGADKSADANVQKTLPLVKTSVVFDDKLSKVPSDWKTYTNDTYKFTIAYPSRYITRVFPLKGSHDGLRLLFHLVTTKSPKYQGLFVDVSNLTLQKVVDNSISNAQSNNITITDHQTGTFKGHDAVRLDSTVPRAPGYSDMKMVVVDVEANGYVYTLGAEGTSDFDSFNNPDMQTMFNSVTFL